MLPDVSNANAAGILINGLSTGVDTVPLGVIILILEFDVSATYTFPLYTVIPIGRLNLAAELTPLAKEPIKKPVSPLPAKVVTAIEGVGGIVKPAIFIILI
jgi:hypothetical protein